MSRYRVAVDVGGTFTDLIVHDEESGSVAIAKTASIPADPAAAIMAALEQASIARATWPSSLMARRWAPMR